jgi:hypothetical protein
MFVSGIRQTVMNNNRSSSSPSRPSATPNTNTNTNTTSTQPAAVKPAPPKARLPSLESIKLEPVDGPELSDTSKQQRRRSLLDLTQSPKPTLLLKEKGGWEGEKEQGPLNDQEKPGGEFVMPSGSQLSNLCRIQVSVVSSCCVVQWNL